MLENMSHRVRQLFLYGFPIGTFVATWIYWPFVQSSGWAFPVYFLVIPYLFALAAVRLMTGPLRLWAWKMPLFHLAFLWCTYSALGLLLVSDTIASPFTLTTVIKSALFCFLIGGLVGTLVDLVGIDLGLLELYYVSMDQGPVNTVLSYSFKFFGSFSAIYGILVKVGYFVLVERAGTQWLPLLTLGASAALILPFMVHFLLGGREPEPDVSAPPTSEPPVVEPPL
jgi:hypothetical protein